MKKSGDLPSAIRAFRGRKDYSQQALAALIGVNQNSVSQYERGKIQPSRAVLLQLEEIADQELKPVVQALLGSDDTRTRTRYEAFEKKLSSASISEIRSEHDRVKAALAKRVTELIAEHDDPRVITVIALLDQNASDPAFDSTLDRIVGILEGAEAPAAPLPPGDDFLDLMREFREFAPQQEIEFFERHAHAIISIQRKERERRKKNALKAG